MKTRDRNRQIVDTPAPIEEGRVTQNPDTEVRPGRQYESGGKVDTQVQKSNRQGSGIPTQQRVDDR
jgi:hypothetical protein